MILITGATGTVGREVVRLCAEKGAQVRALIRSPEKAAEILGPSVELVRGDLKKPETLKCPLDNVDKIFLLTPSSPEQVEMEGNLIEAARRSGIGHLIKLSSLDAKPDSAVAMSRWHWQAEQKLQQSGIPFTLLRPHNFMQNMLTFAPGIRSQGIFRAPMKNGRISMVDARDVAAVAAAVLTQEDHQGEVHRITGPRRLSFQDAAEKLSAALGRKVTYVDIPADVARRALLDAGTARWLADDLIELYRFFGAGRSKLVTDTVEKVARKTPISFDQFARDYAYAFLR